MCGIVGILHGDADEPIDRPLLSTMTSLMAHRGPDGSGIYVGKGLGLGHRRLAVIDLVAGRQPMATEAEDKVLVFNGEIYNYGELRQGLVAGGARLRTHSDTEVLLNLADVDRLRWLTLLRGMFAFAVWFPRQRKLLLARDRFGKKPLYYAVLPKAFELASEAKPLLMHPHISAEVNSRRIPEFLAFRTVVGEETLFQGIKVVPPGCAMVVSQEGLKIRSFRYWEDLVADDDAPRLGGTVTRTDKELVDKLQEAVSYRLVSDVPVGTFNSGGVDSSLVTSMVRASKSGLLHTFSVGFEEADFDESVFAELLARKVGTTHHKLVMSEAEYVDLLEDTIWYLEEPLNHAHTVALLALSRLAKQYVTVVLTGEGADEVFGGYPRYQIPLLVRYLTHFPGAAINGMRRVAELFGMRRGVKLLENADNLPESILESARFVPRSELDKLTGARMQFEHRASVYQSVQEKPGSALERVLCFDRATYLPSLLQRLDKVSMAAGLEARTPFLDHQLVEWSWRLPQESKIRMGRDNKVILKGLARQCLPSSITDRRKVGFGVPLPQWLRNSKGLGGYLDVLQDSRFAEREYVSKDAVNKLITEHQAEKADHSEALWGLMSLELWSRMFLDGEWRNQGMAIPNGEADGMGGLSATI